MEFRDYPAALAQGSNAASIEYDYRSPRPGQQPAHTIYISGVGLIDAPFIRDALKTASRLAVEYRQGYVAGDITDNYCRIIVTRVPHLLLGGTSRTYLEKNRDCPYLDIMIHFDAPQSYKIKWRGSKKAPLTNETTIALFARAFPVLVAGVASAGAKSKSITIEKIWRSGKTLQLGSSGTAMTVQEAIKKNLVMGIGDDLLQTEVFIKTLIGLGFETELADMAGITVAVLRRTFS